jgi:hypothetical protein
VSYTIWFLTLIRLSISVSILRFPLVGILASIVVDSADWDIIGVNSNGMDAMYQNWDKAMDLSAFFFIVLVVRQWQDVWARRVALGFFVYRLIGNILFWIIGWRPVLFFFPNIFENFVVICLTLFWVSKKRELHFDHLTKTILLIVLIIPKMIHEYFQHFLGHQPWEIYPFGSWLGFTGFSARQADWILWGILLYVVPMVGFLLYARSNNDVSVATHPVL